MKKTGQALPLIIEGENIPTDYEEAPLKKIRLNPNNPRLYRLKRQNANPTPEQIQKFLLDEDGVNDLKKQIRDNGGLADPIIVDQDYLVIEGNCRAAIYKSLNTAQPNRESWKKIPARILPPKTTERQIAILQAIFHVHANKIRWGAYEQQHHLHYMQSDLKMDSPTIARVLGLSDAQVRTLLDAYQAMTKHYVKHNPTEDRKVWSHFYEFYKNKDLADYRKDENNVALFAQLVRHKKIEKGADVRKLPVIVKNSKALQKLQNTGVKAAVEEIGKANPSAVFPVFRQVRRTTQLLEDLKSEDLERIGAQPAEQKELQKLYQALIKISKATGLNFK
jgi:ParB-like nuclease domain